MNNSKKDGTIIPPELEFAYAMGLKCPEEESTGIVTAMDFAYAMGLKSYTKPEPKEATKPIRFRIRQLFSPFAPSRF